MPTEALPRRVGLPAALLLASHPVPGFAVTAMATALAVATGRGPAGCLVTALAVLSGQLCVGWTNDVIDVRRDIRAGRRDKPLAAGALAPSAAAAAAYVSGALCVPLSLAAGPPAGAAHLTAVAAALAYDAVLKRTFWSWLPYALAFALLPAFVTLGLPHRPWPPPWLLAAGALLGVGAHLTNVLPDIDTDLAGGIRGLPHRLGRTRSCNLAALALLAASATLVLGPPGRPGVLGWSGLAAATALAATATLPGAGRTPSRTPGPDHRTDHPPARRPDRPNSRLPFLLTIALSALDLTLLLVHGTALR